MAVVIIDGGVEAYGDVQVVDMAYLLSDDQAPDQVVAGILALSDVHPCVDTDQIARLRAWLTERGLCAECGVPSGLEHDTDFHRA